MKRRESETFHFFPPGTRDRYVPLAHGGCEALAAAGVLAGARVDTKAGWCIERPKHLWHFSCAVLAGRFRMITTGGKVLHLKANGPGWLVPNSVGFKLEAVGTGSHVLVWWAVNPLFWSAPSLATAWPPGAEWLIRSLTRLAEERDETGDWAERSRRALSLLATVEIERGFAAFGAGHRRGLDLTTKRVLTAITIHPLHPWTLQELAKLGECSVGHLTRRFREGGLPPPLNALRRRRLGMAATLLVETDDTLERIAEKTAYESPFSLSRAFTRMFGSSPAKYRRLHAAG